MNRIPVQRFAGPVAAWGVYGLPEIRVSRRTVVLVALVALLAALLVFGVHPDLHGLAGGGAIFAGGILTDKSREWRKERGTIEHDIRSLLDAAGGPKLSAEDETRYSKLEARDQELVEAIKREENQAQREADNRTSITDPIKPEPRNDAGDGSAAPEKRTATKEYNAAFRRYLLTGDTRGVIAKETRATSDGLQADSDNAGGFTIAPTQISNRLIKAVDDIVFMRTKATVERVVGAESLGIVSLDADPEDGDWTQELVSVDFDTQMEFGKRELRPHELTKGIKVSRKLLSRSTMDIEGLVLKRLAYKFGITQERAFMTGSGNNRPLGIFTASNDGIPTSRDVTCAATTAFIADDFINALYSLKAQYQSVAEWVLHRDAVKMGRKLKDGDGQYIWRAGLGEGQPDTILGRPFNQSEYAPNTFTTGQYLVVVGDLSFYQIADAEDLSIQRLVELYAATRQIGFIGDLATDGMPVLSEAFARMKLA